MKKFLILLLALLLLAGCSTQESVTPAPAEDASSGTAASDDSAASDGTQEDVFRLTFTANDLEGNPVNQSVFANAKLTMLNVWATFCAPCINEMPDLGELAAQGGTDYQIIGVCSDLDGSEEMLADARDLVAQTGADYLHLQPSESLYPVLTATSSVPVTFFFDSEGKVVGNGLLGAQDKETWAQVLEERLEMVEAGAEVQSDGAA